MIFVLVAVFTMAIRNISMATSKIFIFSNSTAIENVDDILVRPSTASSSLPKKHPNSPTYSGINSKTNNTEEAGTPTATITATKIPTTSSMMSGNGSNEAAYNQSLALPHQSSTIPWSNETTFAYKGNRFNSGFRNQMMAFTIFVLAAIKGGHGQILLNSIQHKDTYGTNRPIYFQSLFDVEHWNSHYPKLPRFVTYDPIVHDQYNGLGWYRAQPDPRNDTAYYTNRNHTIFLDSPTKPYGFMGDQSHLFAAYIRYALKGRGPYINPESSSGVNSSSSSSGHRHPAEILMLQGAIRPHPDFIKIIDERLNVLTSSNDTRSSHNKSKINFMTLHARIEPDMQQHTVCVNKKVYNLTQLFEMMETYWPNDPPAGVQRLFLPINRQYLEKEGDLNAVAAVAKKRKRKPQDNNEVNWIAVENLKTLNHAVAHGLWNGRVKVFEFGANALTGTRYEQRPSTSGALLNFYLAIKSKVFIGTEVSTFSHDIVATRFYNQHKEEGGDDMLQNYKYLPDGIHRWTTGEEKDPPGFGC